MSNVTGEKSWSSAGKTPIKQTFEPLPQKDWEAKIIGSSFEIAKGQEPGSLPYVKGSLEVLDSAITEGGKNRRLFPMFWLSLKPNKNGSISPEMKSNVLGLARALGEETPDFEIVTMEGKVKNENGEVTGTEATQLLDPRAVLQWIKDHDGMVVKLHSKNEDRKGKDGKKTGEKQSVVDYFIETAATATF